MRINFFLCIESTKQRESVFVNSLYLCQVLLTKEHLCAIIIVDNI